MPEEIPAAAESRPWRAQGSQGPARGSWGTSEALLVVEWAIPLFFKLIAPLLIGILGGQGGWRNEQSWRDAEQEDFASG